MSLGLFDLLTPVFATVDWWLETVLMFELRLCLWAFLGAISSVLIYRLLSNQKKIDGVKSELKTAQKTLQEHEGDFSELKSLALTSIKLSLLRLRLTALPALLSVLPVIFILVFLSSKYDHVIPEAKQEINYKITWEAPESVGDVEWTYPTDRQNTHALYWPTEGSKNKLQSKDGFQLLELPATPVSMIHKKQWWNVLLANPAGYLSDDSPIKLIAFDLTAKKPGKYFSVLFDTWHWPYFILIFLFSVLLFVKFKVKF